MVADTVGRVLAAKDVAGQHLTYYYKIALGLNTTFMKWIIRWFRVR